MLNPEIRDWEIKDIIKKFGIERKLIAKGVDMKVTVFNQYLHDGFPKRHIPKIINFLKKYSQELFGVLMNYNNKY